MYFSFSCHFICFQPFTFSSKAKRQNRVKLDGFYSTADSGGCGKACSTSLTTGPPQAPSAPQTACRMSSHLLHLLRDLQSHHREEAITHQEHPPPLPPTNRLIRTGTKSPREHQPFPSAIAQFPPASRPQPSSPFPRRAHQAA